VKNKIKLLVASFFLLGTLQLVTGCETSKKVSQFRLIMKDDYCVSNINAGFTGIKPSFNSIDLLLNKDSLLRNKLSKK